METSQRPEWTFELSGGALCLDFVNTVSGSRHNPTDHLRSYADLLSWSRQTGILSAERAQGLSRIASQLPGEAQRVLSRAHELREALYRIWSAISQRAEPLPGDVGLLNEVLALSLGKQRLVKGKGIWRLDWSREDALDCVLWPVAESAADLLTSREADRVRVCEATQSRECDWVFLDQTKNATRRWCSMQSCGNRAKARRHYKRRKSGAASRT